MPLLHDGSDESRDKNIATLRREGKEEKQAVAIAYSIQRRARGEADPEEVAKGIVTTKGEFAEEHKRLLRVLKSPGHKDDLQEARRQEAEVQEELPGEAEEIIGKADVGPLEEENRQIQRNMKTPQAHGRHEFKAAKWTSGNGHPRCILCGDEEPQDGMCMGLHGAVPTNGDRMAHISKADRGPQRMLTEHEVRQRAHEKEPTDGQRRAGNYPKTHWRMHGMDIAIENLAGTKRSGVGPGGKPWEVVMPYHYGYIKGTKGADGDHLDVAIGPLMDRGTEAHIVNQKAHDGEFDEHKVFIGYPTREAAIHAFRAGRSDNPDKVMGAVLTVPIEELKRWIDAGCMTEQAVLKANI